MTTADNIPNTHVKKSDWRDLLTAPIWHADDVGRRMPDSHHAVSVALPTWDSVVGYEENRPDVREKLQSGYPRFVLPPVLQELQRNLHKDHGDDDEVMWPWPNLGIARLCRRLHQTSRAMRLSLHRRCQASFGADGGAGGQQAAVAIWQHSGYGISTRRALDCLLERFEGGRAAHDLAREQLASCYGVPADHVFLYPWHGRFYRRGLSRIWPTRWRALRANWLSVCRYI